MEPAQSWKTHNVDLGTIPETVNLDVGWGLDELKSATVYFFSDRPDIRERQ